MKDFYLEKRQKVALFMVPILFVLLFLFFPRVFIIDVTNVVELEQYAIETTTSEVGLLSAKATQSDFLYLSDIDYVTGQSKTAWGSLLKDKTSAGVKITLKVDGEWLSFDKGMWAHATSTLVYDIRAYHYDYFSTYIGLNNTASSTSNGVKFYVYTSSDGKNWDLKTEETPTVFKAGTESQYLKVDIAGANYLKLVANDNGSNSNDHAVYADARLLSKNYDPSSEYYQKIHKVDYYDAIIRQYDTDYNMNNNYRLVLERELVNKLGYWNIQKAVKGNDKAISTMDWILSDNKVLEQVIEVGQISNTTTFLTIVQDLYQTYKGELSTLNGDVYTKMIIGMAAAYSTDRVSSPLTFSHKSASYDYMERFAIIKEMYDKGLMLYGNGWKTYPVEFFRYLMNDSTRNDELKWMNYIGKAKNYSTGVYTYVGYVKPNYSMSAKPHLYDIANKEKYETKWHLAEYGVPFADATTRYWMVMEAGGICWNQARVAKSVIIGMGRPSITVFQVDHESALFYTAENKDGTGKGSWSIAGNIYGWGKTCNAWYGGNRTRTLFGWSSKPFTFYSTNGSSSGDSAGYIYLAQANLNNYDVYKKSYYFNLIANSFENNEDKLKIYNKALEVNPINLDSYDLKIQMYRILNKTSEEWHQLALDIIDNYTFYPMAMGDLMKLIKPYLNGVDRVDIDQKYYDALVRAKNATASDIWQTSAAKQIASARLGSANNKLASFSFDGANAGKIVLHKDYDTFTDLMWKYSLDGGVTKSEGILAHSLQLSKEELAKINDVNDIQIYIVGLTETKPTYTIDIVKGTISNDLYGNDLENRVVGVGLTYEWRHSEKDEWTSYRDASPDNTGDTILYVRNGAVGSALPSETIEFTFTEDNQPLTRQYITVAQLSIEEYYTQSKDTKRPFYAPNAIDGNIHTMWHTDFALDVRNDKEQKPFITIKLEYPKYISAVEFMQMQYKVEDYIQNARIYVSEDNKTWKEAGKIENCPKNIGLRVIDFDESIYGQYVKIEMDTYSMFANLAMVNIFKDVTKQDEVVPTATIGYDVTTLTNGDVLARVVSSSEPVTITNNGGSDTKIFTKNGKFTFEFENEMGVKGTATAVVDWIDKEAPQASVKYSVKTPTNQTVDVTLTDIYDLQNGKQVLDGNFYILDEKNNKINFVEVKNKKVVRVEYLDVEGNITKIYYLDTNGNTERVEYYYREEGKELIIYTAYLNTTGTTINTKFTNENGEEVNPSNKEEIHGLEEISRTTPLSYTLTTNNRYTFRVQDLAGNISEIVANVDWIDKEAPKAVIIYNINEMTNEKVVATIILNEKGTIINNNGLDTYTFNENGEFTFTFKDLAGNTNSAIARVDWIIKKGNDNNDNNSNISLGNQNTNQGNVSSGSQETNTTKPSNNNGNTTNTKVPTTGSSISEVIDSTITTDKNKVDNNASNETNNNSTQEIENKNEQKDNNDKKDDVDITQNNPSKENHYNMKVIVFIGICSFISLLALIKLLVKGKKERL